MDEYRRKANRILGVAVGLTTAGMGGFAVVKGWESAAVFATSAAVSLGSLYLLARGVEMLSSGGKGWLKPLGFVVRFLIYALALSGIIKVYPGHSLELFFGVFLSVMAILIEALIESYTNART